MKVELRLFAFLRQHYPPEAESQATQFETSASDVRSLADELGIPHSTIAIVLINGRPGNLDSKFQESDVVSLFPPIAGG